MSLGTRESTIASQQIFKGTVISLRVDTVQLPNGVPARREVVEHNGGVVIVCQPERDKLILIRQYRYPCDEELLELPAGRIELGEEPLAAAQREIIEETGYQAASWELMAKMYSAPGFCSEMLYLYQARDLAFVGKNLDYDESIEVLIMPVAEAWALIRAGKVRDAKTIAGIGLLRG